jgi:hypothetical protein
MATKKVRRVKHLNEVPARVHLKAGKLKIVVEISWDDLQRRLGIPIEGGKFRKKRKR